MATSGNSLEKASVLKILILSSRPLALAVWDWRVVLRDPRGNIEQAGRLDECLLGVTEHSEIQANGNLLTFTTCPPCASDDAIARAIKSSGIPTESVQFSERIIELSVQGWGEERESILSALQGSGRAIAVQHHQAASWGEVQQTVLKHGPFDIVHFSGHGKNTHGMCGLLFERDEVGVLGRCVSPEEFARVFRDNATLVVTSACESQPVVERIVKGDGDGTSVGICVDGEHSIEAKAMLAFNSVFYAGLASGKTVEQAFRAGIERVRSDEAVGEAALPNDLGNPSPWKRLVLTGDTVVQFADATSGSVSISELCPKSPQRVRIPKSNQIFVGRVKETVDLVRLLAPPASGTTEQKARVVTLHGEPGMGKTRLAQAVADWHAERGKFKGGIYEVSCDGFQLPLELCAAVARAFDERADDVDASTAGTSIAAAAKHGRVLLILDNLDDLFTQATPQQHAGMFLRQWITQVPELVILATCRSKLELGQDEAAARLDRLTTTDATKLFRLSIPRDRLRNSFSKLPNHQYEAAVKRILDATQCIPLCLVLAAHRLGDPDTNIQEWLEKLSTDLLNLLNAPEWRDLSPRQRSMRASLKLSVDAVSPVAQELFRKLACFPRGLFKGYGRKFDLLLGIDWQIHARELVAKALLRYDTDSERYLMLRVMFEYSRELFDSTDDDPFAEQVAEFWEPKVLGYSLSFRPEAFLTEIFKNDIAPGTPDERRTKKSQLKQAGMISLDEEFGNFVPIILWLFRKKQPAAVRMTSALLPYLQARGQWHLWQDLCSECLSLAKTDEESRSWKVNLAISLQSLGDTDRALELCEEAITVMTDKRCEGYAHALNTLAGLYAQIGLLAKAEAIVHEMLEIYKGVKNLLHEGKTYNNLGFLYLRMSRFAEAEDAVKKAMNISQDSELDDRQGIGSACWTLGALFNRTGLYAEAEKALTQAASICREFKNVPNSAGVMVDLAETYLRTGRLIEAEVTLEAARGLQERLGESLSYATSTGLLGEVLFEKGDTERARLAFKMSLSMRSAQNDPLGVVKTQLAYAEFLRCNGQACEAGETIEQALGTAERVRDHASVGKGLMLQAIHLWQEGDIQNAMDTSRQCVEIFEELRDYVPLVDARALQGALCIETQDWHELHQNVGVASAIAFRAGMGLTRKTCLKYIELAKLLAHGRHYEEMTIFGTLPLQVTRKVAETGWNREQMEPIGQVFVGIGKTVAAFGAFHTLQGSEKTNAAAMAKQHSSLVDGLTDGCFQLAAWVNEAVTT